MTKHLQTGKYPVLKWLTLLILLSLPVSGKAQFQAPVTLSISYFGEMITHPGLKIGVNFRLKQWQHDQNSEALYLSLSLGSFFHRRYQTGVFLYPEINYGKQFSSGATISGGLGFGYLRTFIPNTFEINMDDRTVTKTRAGHHYFLPGISVMGGKEINDQNRFPSHVFVKPNFYYAFPNFPKGVGYFSLELGSSLNLRNDE